MFLLHTFCLFLHVNNILLEFSSLFPYSMKTFSSLFTYSLSLGTLNRESVTFQYYQNIRTILTEIEFSYDKWKKKKCLTTSRLRSKDPNLFSLGSTEPCRPSSNNKEYVYRLPTKTLSISSPPSPFISPSLPLHINQLLSFITITPYCPHHRAYHPPLNLLLRPLDSDELQIQNHNPENYLVKVVKLGRNQGDKLSTEQPRPRAKPRLPVATLLVPIAIFVVPSAALTHPTPPPPPPPAPMEAVAVPRSAAACRVAPALPASRATARPLPLPRSALSAAPGRRLVARRVAAAGDKVETAQEAVPIEKSRSICSTPVPRPSVLGSC
jgi:hypothetical protein